MYSRAISHTLYSSTLLDQLELVRRLIKDLTTCPEMTAALTAQLQARHNTLHSVITLSADSAPVLLTDFVLCYIEQVPDFIETIVTLTHEAGIGERIDPLLKVALAYFTRPPKLIQHQDTVQVLLAAAYLAHRLLEEINDRIIGRCGSSLAPMDTTRANIIAHELIGEPFAGELDQAVLFSAELLLAEHNFQAPSLDRFFAQRRALNRAANNTLWPCLAAERAIFLSFDTRRDQ